jgi:hypothetical protein
MTVETGSIEGMLYAKLDKFGIICSGSYFKERFELGDGQFMEIKINNNSGKPINMNDIVKTGSIDFSINFWSDTEWWFRVDNAHGYLHSDMKSGLQPFKVTLPETYSIVGLVSEVFDNAENILKEKFPHLKVRVETNITGFV